MAAMERPPIEASQTPGSRDTSARPGGCTQLVRSLGHTRAFAWLGVHFFTPLDKRLFSLTRGAFNTSAAADLPVLFLTTLGRKTDQQI